MARLRRDARLETREARAPLALSEGNTAYWRTIEPKLAIGYYKGPQGGTWLCPQPQGRSVREGSLGACRRCLELERLEHPLLRRGAKKDAGDL